MRFPSATSGARPASLTSVFSSTSVFRPVSFATFGMPALVTSAPHSSSDSRPPSDWRRRMSASVAGRSERSTFVTFPSGP